jgi:hypothetical protein
MVLAFGPPKFDRDISPVDITAFAETLTEGFQPAGERSGRLGTKISDHRHCRLLAAHRHRPRGRPAKSCDELTPFYLLD